MKKLSSWKDLSDKQFLDEVFCLKKVKHKNIVRFLGYCADTQGEVMEVEGKLRIVEVPQRLLCFEYVPNGNLHHYLKGIYSFPHCYSHRSVQLTISATCSHDMWDVAKPESVIMPSNMH